MAWYFKRIRLYYPLRFIAITCLIFALSNPLYISQSKQTELWVLLDESLSALNYTQQNQEEWIRLFTESKSEDQTIRILRFGKDSKEEIEGQGEIININRDETRIRSSIEAALQKRSSEKEVRIALFSDGFSTEPIQTLENILIRDQIPLFYRLYPGSNDLDYQIDSFETPAQVNPGEPFLIKAQISGPDSEIPFILKRDDRIIHQGKIKLQNSIAEILIEEQIIGLGAANYSVEILPENDAQKMNNFAKDITQVRSAGYILLVSSIENDPIYQLLKSLGFTVRLVNEPKTFTPGFFGQL